MRSGVHVYIILPAHRQKLHTWSCGALYMCECFFSTAVSRSVHGLPGCLEPVRCCGHVGCFWRCNAGPTRCIRPCRRLRQVLHHLQPSGLPAVQAQLPRVSLQRHVHVEAAAVSGKSAFGTEGTLGSRLAAQQGHECFHTPFKWTAGQLWGLSAVH